MAQAEPIEDAMADEAIELRVLDDASSRPELRAYLFAVVLRGTTTEAGRIVLRVDHEDPGLMAHAGHVGCEIAPEHRGRHLALRACRLLAPLARRHRFAELWLMTSPDNAASLRTIELLGAMYVDTVDVPVHSDMRLLGLTRVHRHRWSL
ncbi:GNAT family N-acetyltransferase [Nannocystis radixulma]|uniref:GNAT family N-acetyltransferase n=1 Tax=Nannocystis radixulma TaxID=2995305 RepID=A0ABT5BMI2_9BACT|nr:GNAT family N-acetyltransferase [Nannocystis radixulma]MDC0675375.1 GNAT family N-acetyltransferase [Nannocystis radixulma]